MKREKDSISANSHLSHAYLTNQLWEVKLASRISCRRERAGGRMCAVQPRKAFLRAFFGACVRACVSNGRKPFLSHSEVTDKKADTHVPEAVAALHTLAWFAVEHRHRLVPHSSSCAKSRADF